MHPRSPRSVPELGRLVDELIKCRVHIVRKLYFRNRPHPLRSTANSEAHDTLFAQRRVEDALRAKVRRKTHAAPEDAAKRDVFTEEKHAVVGRQRMAEGGVDGLEEVQALGGG